MYICMSSTYGQRCHVCAHIRILNGCCLYVYFNAVSWPFKSIVQGPTFSDLIPLLCLRTSEGGRGG